MHHEHNSFVSYPLSLDLLYQMLVPSGSHNLIRKSGGGFRQVIQALYDRDFSEISQSIDCLIHAEEFYWLSQSRRIYYPVAESLLDVSESSITESADSLFNDIDDCFILAVPRGMRFGCEEVLSGFLVTIVHNKARDTLLHWPFFDWVGQPRLTCAFDNEDDISFCVNYVPATMSTNTDINISGKSDEDEDESVMLNRVRLVLNSSVIRKYLQQPSLKTFLAILTESDAANAEIYSSLSDEERAQQYDIVLYVINFLLYRKANPKAIKPGVPGGSYKAFETEIAKELQHFIVC